MIDWGPLPFSFITLIIMLKEGAENSNLIKMESKSQGNVQIGRMQETWVQPSGWKICIGQTDDHLK